MEQVMVPCADATGLLHVVCGSAFLSSVSVPLIPFIPLIAPPLAAEQLC